MMATLQERIHDAAEAQSEARAKIKKITRPAEGHTDDDLDKAITQIVFATADLVKLNTAQDLAQDARPSGRQAGSGDAHAHQGVQAQTHSHTDTVSG